MGKLNAVASRNRDFSTNVPAWKEEYWSIDDANYERARLRGGVVGDGMRMMRRGSLILTRTGRQKMGTKRNQRMRLKSSLMMGPGVLRFEGRSNNVMGCFSTCSLVWKTELRMSQAVDRLYSEAGTRQL